jgi:hypothetical protein
VVVVAAAAEAAVVAAVAVSSRTHSAAGEQQRAAHAHKSNEPARLVFGFVFADAALCSAPLICCQPSRSLSSLALAQ